MHQVWEVSRLLSGKRVGPKRRKYDVPKSVRLAVSEWKDFLQLPGPQGGCSATVVEWDQVAHAAEVDDSPCHSLEDSLRHARQDLRALQSRAKLGKLRKSVPPWGLPAEVWRQLLLPEWRMEQQRAGVGYKLEISRSVLFHSALFKMLVSIRMYGRTPVCWQRSFATELDKKNGKSGPAGLRLINNLDVLGKWFYDTLWKRGKHQHFRDYASGYLRNKSRIDSMLQQEVLLHRLRQHKVSHVLSLYDVANAFPSPTRQALEMAICQVARPDDVELLQQRHRQTYMHIEARNGILCVQPGSGGLQGDCVACGHFLEVYHPAIDQWRDRTAEQELHMQDPVSQDVLDVSISTYADDVARCTVADCSESMAAELVNSNDILDRSLGSIGVQQNVDKQEHVAFFAGVGSSVFYEDVYKHGVLPGKRCTCAKYLGGYKQFKGSNHCELGARKAAVERGFYTMGRFWSRNKSLRPAAMVFGAMVRGVAFSGLEALLLSESEYKRLDSIVNKFARKVLRGAACKRTLQEDGQTLYRAMPDDDVCKLLRFVPARVELCVRRLQYWQSVAKCPHLHKTVLAAVFGKLHWDSAASVRDDGGFAACVNPWVGQFQEDMVALLKLDSAAERLHGIGDRFFLVFTDYRADFLAIDCTELRSSFFSVCVPPPGVVIPMPQSEEQQMQDQVGGEVEERQSFACDCKCEDGSTCAATFGTAQALAMHQRRTKGGTHGHVHPHVRAAVCNQCLFCKHVFTSIRTTQNHIRNTLRVLRCTGAGSVTCTKVIPPMVLVCPICDDEKSSLHELLQCIAQHFPQVSRT